MKLTIPGILFTALIVASPAAFAQNTGYSGTTSKPGASVAKDDTTKATMTKQSKKHTANEVQGANIGFRQYVSARSEHQQGRHDAEV